MTVRPGIVRDRIIKLACKVAKHRVETGVILCTPKNGAVTRDALKAIAPMYGGAWSEENQRAEWPNGSTICVQTPRPRWHAQPVAE